MAGLMKVVDEEKPEFVIVQYGKTDDVFHAHGPFSKEAGEACAEADAWLGKLVPWLRARGYAIIITADHGQHEITRDEWDDGRVARFGKRRRLPGPSGLAAQCRPCQRSTQARTCLGTTRLTIWLQPVSP